MKTNLFISRELQSDSAFHSLSKKHNLRIDAQSLLAFKKVDFKQPSTSWLFFYSRNGIKYFINNNGNIHDRKIAIFGPTSSNYFKNLTGKTPEFTGNANRLNVADEFNKTSNGESCLFVVGKNSLRSIQKLRTGFPEDYEIIVYDNTLRDEFLVQLPQIAVFTSPLSVKGYFEKYNNRNHVNFSIGPSTHNALLQLEKTNSIMANSPSESSLAKSVNTYLEKCNKF